jgi:hypothetical protein
MVASLTAKHLIDTAFVLTVITQLVSLSDLILLPEQKRSIERLCDDLTLRLDFLKTIEWLRQWLRTARRAQIVILLFRPIQWLTVVGAVAAMVWAIRDSGWLSGLLFGILCLWTGVGFAIGILPRVWKEWGQPVVNWLSTHETVFGLFFAYGVVVTLGGALAALTVFLWKSGEEMSLNTGYVLFLMSGAVIVWFLIVIDGIVTLSGAVVVLLGQLTVAVARSIMWRISRFPKGPVAAFTTAMLALLAILHVVITAK